MKIVIITCESSYQRYFVNRIQQEFDLSALFIVRKSPQNIDEEIKRYIHGLKKHWKKGGKSFSGVFRSYRATQERKKLMKELYPSVEEKRRLQKKILKRHYDKFVHQAPIYTEYKDVNSTYFQSKIKEINPDLLLVFGGPIVGDEIINSANIAAINLHWGLSPYYRGGRTTIWPIYNDEPEYIGVTIHRLSEKIDGGEIITQDQPKLEEDDNLYSLELKLSKLGTSLVLDVIESIKVNGRINATKQDFSKGKLYLGEDLTLRVIQEVHKKLSNSFFKQHLPIEKDQNQIDLVQHV